jgi:hypothetical protein
MTAHTLRDASFGALFLVTLLASCGEAGPLNPTVTEAFVPEELEFGSRPASRLHSLPLVLTNLSSETLRVDDVGFEPNSLAYSVQQEDAQPLRGLVLGARESANLTVLFFPTEPGSYDASMVVRLGQDDLRLPIRAQARDPLLDQPQFSPSGLNFGNASVGEVAQRSIALENPGSLTWNLRQIIVQPPFDLRMADGTPIRATEIGPDQSMSLAAYFRPLIPGTFSNRAGLVFEEGPTSWIDLSGSAQIPGTLRCLPSPLAFGNIPRGESRSVSLTCTSSIGPYNVSSVNLSIESPSIFSISGGRLSGAAPITFDVNFDARGAVQTYNGTVELRSTHGALDSVPISGSVVTPADSATDLFITMDWGTVGTDFDLHLVRNSATPYTSGADCHYAAKTLDWGTLGDEIDDPFLDNDQLLGPASETMSLIRAQDSVYDVYVQYFGATVPVPASTLVRISVRSRRGFSQNRTRALVTCGDMWHVGRVTPSGTSLTFQPVDTVTSAYASRTTRCP